MKESQRKVFCPLTICQPYHAAPQPLEQHVRLLFDGRAATSAFMAATSHSSAAFRAYRSPCRSSVYYPFPSATGPSTVIFEAQLPCRHLSRILLPLYQKSSGSGLLLEVGWVQEPLGSWAEHADESRHRVVPPKGLEDARPFEATTADVPYAVASCA